MIFQNVFEYIVSHLAQLLALRNLSQSKINYCLCKYCLGLLAFIEKCVTFSIRNWFSVYSRTSPKGGW